MSLRRRSVLLRVGLLVLVPLIFLVGLSGYMVSTSVSSALALVRSKVMMDDLGQRVASLQQALTHERAQMTSYYARPTPAALAALQRQDAVTNRAAASLTAAMGSRAVRQSASAGGKKAIAALGHGLAGLSGLQTAITGHSIKGQAAFLAYSDMIAASYQLLEQAILQEGSSTQVLPGIAVIELAISNEYLEQESALLDGDFAARAFPASDQQAFVRLVGAHRLLYAQSYAYLDPADRSGLNHDVSPGIAHTLVRLENRLVASSTPNRAPPVRPALWNRTVATLSAQTQRTVGQAEARLASGARSQASAKLHRLYLAGGAGLAAVIASLALSLWIAVNLTRQLHGLRDSALEMANVRLPDVVRRLRAGENVDVAAQVPRLDPGVDEIGQVKAAFNTAQRTAVMAAVDEASVRRGINDVFRNLARRSQSLLERQMALLDALERRAAEPGDLEGLFRIDHLTTRMRRHAESLIVLAGDSPQRAFRNPVPFMDVLRAAAAEVEDYTRIKVICRTPAALAGPAVADVIHLLAEFMENATIFAPSNTEVRITGDLVANGFAVDIEDRGQGMSEEEIATVNASLADPPPFDLSGSGQLGIFVAAQLARRHGIQVTLRPSAYGGVTAIVLIPRALVVSADANGHRAIPERARGGRLTPAVRHAVAAQAGTGAPPASAAWDSPAPAACDPPAANPADLPPSTAPPGTDPPEPVTGPGSAEPAAFALVTAPHEPDLVGPPRELTENGLPLRIRQASLAPQLQRRTSATSPGGDAAGSRLPEAASSTMSAFRRGWQRGFSEGGTDAGHGADPKDGDGR